MIRVFETVGLVQAMAIAEAWCKDRGMSVGQEEPGRDRALRFGAHELPKWTELRQCDKDQIDGRMGMDEATGKVTVTINDGAVHRHYGMKV